MRTLRYLTSTLVLSAISGFSGAALADDHGPAADAPAAPAGETPPATDAAPAAEPAPVATPEPAPAVDPTPPPAPAEEPPITTASTEPPTMSASADTAGAAPAEPPAEEEGVDPSAWIRFDSDALGMQIWAGATNNIAGVFDLATDIYIVDFGGTSFGEFDIGPAFSFGPVGMIPMIGIGYNWGNQELSTLIAPQLFTIVDPDAPIYFESWIQGFINSIFTDGAGDSLYFRQFLLFKATSDLHIGPQAEITVALNDDAKAGANGDKSLISANVGGRVNYNALGDWDALIGLYVGYEVTSQGKASIVTDPATGETREADGIVGRFTYLHTF